LEDRVTGIITVCSGKGGVSKTTSALAIAGALKVLGTPPDAVIDLDYGASLTRAYGYQPATPFSEALLDGTVSFADALHETEEGLALIPASAALANVDREKLELWRARLIELGREHLLVIDTSDDILSAPVAAAILAADVLAIPVPLAKKAYERTFPEIAGLLQSFEREPEQVWFGAMVDQRAALPRHVLKTIAEDGVELAVHIPRGIAIDEADFRAASVVATHPKSKVAAAYVELATVIYARLRRLSGAAPGKALGRQTRELPLAAVNG
jgi:cellulose biosynthesis protein BcsQ